MRRKTDGWVNATHILKVANFDKPQRTRILEKEVQKGVHEKIQGGYGKYQGTWVPLEVARELAYQYRVDDVLMPLFIFRESSTSPPPPVKRAGKSKSASSSSGPALSRNASRLKSQGNRTRTSASPAAADTANQFTSTTVIESPNSTATASVKILSNFSADQVSTPSSKRGRGRPSNSTKAAAAAAAQAAIAAGSSNFGSSASVSLKRSNTKLRTPLSRSKKQKLYMSPTSSEHIKHSGYDDSMNLSEDSASVSSRSSSPSDYPSDTGMPDHQTPLENMSARSQEITNASALKKQDNNQDQFIKDEFNKSDSNGNVLGNRNGEDGEIHNIELIAAQYGRKLLDYFMAPEDDEIPDYLIHPPEGFDINHGIDDEGHTAFHWACSMGNCKIIVALLKAGASMYAKNLLGQTPLMRTVMFTNSYDLRTFSRIVDLLRDTVSLQDNDNRTILHHIAESTAPRSKLSSARYYTEILLAKLSETEPTKVVVEIFVNQKDAKGDTALHIAARNEAKKCVKVLQSYQASLTILNKAGASPQDFINAYEAARHKYHSRHQQQQALHHQLTPSQDITSHISSTYGGYPDHGFPQYQYAGSGESEYPKPNSSPTHAYTHVYSHDPISTPAKEGHHPSGTLSTNGRSENRYPTLSMSTPLTQLSSKTFSDSHVFDSNNTGLGESTLRSSASLVTSGLSGSSQSHPSETGENVMARHLPLVLEKFEQLSRIYDSVICDKLNDVDQVRQLCDNVKDDVKATEILIQEHIKNYGDETEAEQKSKAAEDLVKQRITCLRKVVDRSQARNLAELVKEEESKAGPEYQEELEKKYPGKGISATSEYGSSAGTSVSSNTDLGLGEGTDLTTSSKNDNSKLEDQTELALLAMDLMDLQRRRQDHVTEILDLWSTAGAGEKMHKYRRLVAMSCGVKIDEIDQLLGEIEQVLSETSKDPTNNAEPGTDATAQ